MIEGIDFCFIYPKDDNETVHIKFLQGPYKDTVFKYGKVKFEEKNGEPHLQFAFDVIESPLMKPKKMELDKKFQEYVFHLLVDFISDNLDEDIIDETGTNNFEEPGLQ